jgi:hypothetical protein
MEPVAPERMPGERKLAGVAEYEAAFDELIANSTQTVRIFDRGIGRGFVTPHRYELFRTLLLANRNNRVRIVLHETSNVVRDCPRLMSLLRQFSHTLSLHQTLRAARHVYDPFVIGDDSRFIRRFHFNDLRGIATIGDVAYTNMLLKRFEELWATSVQAVTATTIGL